MPTTTLSDPEHSLGLYPGHRIHHRSEVRVDLSTPAVARQVYLPPYRDDMALASFSWPKNERRGLTKHDSYFQQLVLPAYITIPTIIKENFNTVFGMNLITNKLNDPRDASWPLFTGTGGSPQQKVNALHINREGRSQGYQRLFKLTRKACPKVAVHACPVGAVVVTKRPKLRLQQKYPQVIRRLKRTGTETLFGNGCASGIIDYRGLPSRVLSCLYNGGCGHALCGGKMTGDPGSYPLGLFLVPS